MTCMSQARNMLRRLKLNMADSWMSFQTNPADVTAAVRMYGGKIAFNSEGLGLTHTLRDENLQCDTHATSRP